LHGVTYQPLVVSSPVELDEDWTRGAKGPEVDIVVDFRLFNEYVATPAASTIRAATMTATIRADFKVRTSRVCLSFLNAKSRTKRVQRSISEKCPQVEQTLVGASPLRAPKHLQGTFTISRVTLGELLSVLSSPVMRKTTCAGDRRRPRTYSGPAAITIMPTGPTANPTNAETNIRMAALDHEFLYEARTSRSGTRMGSTSQEPVDVLLELSLVRRLARLRSALHLGAGHIRAEKSP
jgi:hypothetical protein